MKAKWFIFVILGCVLFLQGCATVGGAAKGGAEGFKEDWKSAGKVDAWMQENMW